MRVLITGAASGFGAAISSELRARGEDVAGIDIQPADGVLVADVRAQDQVDDAVARAVERLGGLDVLINNAGIGEPQDSGLAPDDRAVACLETNFLGAWRVTSAALPHLLESGGRVVNVASGLAYFTLPYSAAYAASKRALVAYSDVLRIEYGDRIGVTTIYPGYVRTPIHARSEQMGLSLAGTVPEERLAGVVRTVVRACYGRARRDVGTSLQTGFGIRLGRHFPAAVDFVVRRQFRRLVAKGSYPGRALFESHRPRS